jgi:putative membrane protein
MDDWSWGAWLLMTVTMVAFWALVALVVVIAIRATHRPTDLSPDPERTLAQRFAAGDITDDEYQRRLDVLKGVAGPG